MELPVLRIDIVTPQQAFKFHGCGTCVLFAATLRADLTVACGTKVGCGGDQASLFVRRHNNPGGKPLTPPTRTQSLLAIN